MSQAADKLETFADATVPRVDKMVGSQFLGELQAVIGKVDGNNVSRSQHTGLHKKAHAERSHAENDHGVVEKDGFGWQVVWNTYQKTSRNNIDVLGPSAKQMWRVGGTHVVAVIDHVLAEVVG